MSPYSSSHGTLPSSDVTTLKRLVRPLARLTSSVVAGPSSSGFYIQSRGDLQKVGTSYHLTPKPFSTVSSISCPNRCLVLFSSGAIAASIRLSLAFTSVITTRCLNVKIVSMRSTSVATATMALPKVSI